MLGLLWVRRWGTGDGFSKFLSFYLTVLFFACLLWLQQRTPVPNFSTSLTYCRT